MALKDKRKLLLEVYDAKKQYLKNNQVLYDIYSGNLLPYLQNIMKGSLSERYYQTIKDRILPVNILDRYIGKVATAYSKPPKRSSKSGDETINDFVSFYADRLDINSSGMIVDSFSNLFKGYAWEPYIDLKGRPQLRELPFDRFFVYSESEVSPETETIFVKMVKQVGDKILFFSYTDQEFDAFYSDESDAFQYLQENNGVNLIGTIPFVYGKRDKNRLYPVQDTDLYGMITSLPIMLSDGAGAQMYQAFSVLYGVDVESENLTISPNAFWNFKSDKSTDKQPTVGVLTPTADTEKVLSFATQVFTLWLETKGIRVGSVGNLNAQSFSSGISKIIDEMDVFEIKKKSIQWYEKDESELWNEKMKLIHNYWIDSKSVDVSKVPPKVGDSVEMDVQIVFDEPKPMVARSEEIANCKAEVDLGTMTIEQAIRKLHPEYSEDLIQETINRRNII